jgi:isoquinoline 1-oxidoreductase beta subunit
VLRVVRIDPTPGAPHFNPLGGVAVIGRNTWAAIQGRNALKIVWDDGPNASYDSAAYRKTLEDAARKARSRSCATTATSPRRTQRRRRRITAEYYCPHLAHASMEAPAASARITDGKCEVWGCFQSPQAARDLVAKRLDMPCPRT